MVGQLLGGRVADRYGLRWAYLVTCTDVVTDADGEPVEVRCTYDPATRGGDAPDGRKVRGTLHWVSARHAVDAEVRLYDRLFSVPSPGAGGVDFREHLNPASLEMLSGCKLEPSLADAPPGHRVQFERQGYFVSDDRDHAPNRPVFNRTVPLKDTWAKISGATIVASDSMMKDGVPTSSLPQVIFSLGIAPE